MSFHLTPPIRSESRATHHLETSDVLQVDHVISCEKCPVTIDALPEIVLLQIFLFDRLIHLNGRTFSRHRPWRWDRLVHVCYSWRSIIFASPKFLDLNLFCRPWSPMDPTGIWPPLPIVVLIPEAYPPDSSFDQAFDAVTMHRNRVREIHLNNIRSSQTEGLASTMRGQFPALIHFTLTCDFEEYPTLLDGILDGSAPLLQTLTLLDFPFTALPNLLLCATDLADLTLMENCNFGYIPPEEILNCLAVVSRLKSLTLSIEYFPSPDGESRHASPPTSIVLPILTHFDLDGYIGYLEVLVARIDAPLLNSIRTNLDFQPTSDFPQLAQFMRRSTRFQPPNELHVDFRRSGMHVRSFRPRHGFGDGFRLKISCEDHWNSSPLVQGFASLLPSVHMVDHLYIYMPSQHSSISFRGYMEFFHLLTGVKNLYLPTGLGIDCDLEDLVGERVADVLPALERIFFSRLNEYVQKRIGRFAAARQLLGRPVAISTWNKTGDRFVF